MMKNRLDQLTYEMEQRGHNEKERKELRKNRSWQKWRMFWIKRVNKGMLWWQQ